MDPFVNEKDFELIAQDRYTFAVLCRILQGSCEWIRSDHGSLILCHSEMPYPVWAWTPDGCGEDTMETAWNLAHKERPLQEGYHYNMKYDLAEYFIRRGRDSGLNIRIYQQLFAYDCPSPAAPDQPTDGNLYCCTEKDLEEAVEILSDFYRESGLTAPPRSKCIEKAKQTISEQALHFWKTGDGRTASCCYYQCTQELASINSVYTKPEYRRRHYAQHMVFLVTKKVKESGYTPMLYTDANYPASNACYEKIGYILRGKLCTIAAVQ